MGEKIQVPVNSLISMRGNTVKGRKSWRLWYVSLLANGIAAKAHRIFQGLHVLKRRIHHAGEFTADSFE